MGCTLKRTLLWKHQKGSTLLARRDSWRCPPLRRKVWQRLGSSTREAHGRGGKVSFRKHVHLLHLSSNHAEDVSLKTLQTRHKCVQTLSVGVLCLLALVSCWTAQSSCFCYNLLNYKSMT